MRAGTCRSQLEIGPPARSWTTCQKVLPLPLTSPQSSMPTTARRAPSRAPLVAWILLLKAMPNWMKPNSRSTSTGSRMANSTAATPRSWREAVALPPIPIQSCSPLAGPSVSGASRPPRRLARRLGGRAAGDEPRGVTGGPVRGTLRGGRRLAAAGVRCLDAGRAGTYGRAPAARTVDRARRRRTPCFLAPGRRAALRSGGVLDAVPGARELVGDVGEQEVEADHEEHRHHRDHQGVLDCRDALLAAAEPRELQGRSGHLFVPPSTRNLEAAPADATCGNLITPQPPVGGPVNGGRRFARREAPVRPVAPSAAATTASRDARSAGGTGALPGARGALLVTDEAGLDAVVEVVDA